MRVMRVGNMRVRMAHGSVAVRVAVGPGWRRLVHMVVVAVVMGVGMLMRHGFMGVHVGMPFHQVQQHAGQHQCAAGQHGRTGGAVCHHKGQRATDERSKGKDRAGARRAEGPLRQQVKAHLRP